MKTVSSLLLLCLLGGCLLCGTASAGQVYLWADFNDKPINSPIGTKGASEGEPVEVYSGIIATVRAGPMPTPSLELQDDSGATTGLVAFEFLGSAELTTETVAVSADLWFHELSPGYDFLLYVREQGGAAKSFANVSFNSSGEVFFSDATTPYTKLIGEYPLDRVFPIKIVFDMEAGTTDVWLDGRLVLADDTHGITDRGIGSVYFGCDYDAALDGSFYVDNISVVQQPRPVPCIRDLLLLGD